MTAITSIDFLEAAVYALVGERCRHSYLHDVRGGLQSLQTAVELLARTATTPGENSAIAEKASMLGRRAVQNHEKALAELLNQLTPLKEAVADVNVGELVTEVLRFMKNEAAGKSITFRLESAADVRVSAQAHKFRLMVLGLVASLIDASAPGNLIDVAVARAGSNAVIEFSSGIPCPEVRTVGDTGFFVGAASLYELVLALIEQWAPANGGRLLAPASDHLPTALRIHYPLASS